MDRKFICCICHNTFIGYGNNPYPYNKNVNALCCNQCNLVYVIPARLKEIEMKEVSEDE